MKPILDVLTAQPVVIVAGKGGVGKTTVTALVANAAASQGRSVLVVDLDGKPQLASLVRMPDHRDGKRVEDEEHPDAVAISPGEALEEYLADHGFRRIARRLVQTGVIELVAAATPGINDVVVLGKIKQIANSGRYDLIVVDGPAAGRALSMLTSAHGLTEVASGGPVRRQADEVSALLSNPERCGIVLVTLAETTPVSELIEMAFDVEERAGVALNGVVVNGLLDGAVSGAPAGDEGPVATFVSRRIEVQRSAIERLTGELPLPSLGVPLLPTAELKASDLVDLSDALASDSVENQAPAQAHGQAQRQSNGQAAVGVFPVLSLPDGWSGASDNSSQRRSAASADASVVGATEQARLSEVVAERETLLVVGSGGAGKTTTSAAIGLGAAQRGRRAVVVTIDPARRLAEALGMPDGLTDEPTLIDPGAGRNHGPGRDHGRHGDGEAGGGELWAMMLNPQAMLKRVVERYAADDEQVQRIVTNPVFNELVTRLSGTQEYMATEALYELANDERFDLVIVDTPPSRQTLNFLESPGLLSRFLAHRLFRLMMLPTRSSLKVFGDATQVMLRQVGKVVGTDVLADATAFFQAFAGMDEGFRERAVAVDDLLRADSTGFVLAAGPNADTVADAMWFADRLRELKVDVAATIINRIVPLAQPSPAASEGDGSRSGRSAPGEIDDESSAGHAEGLASAEGVLGALAVAQRAAIEPLLDVSGSTTLVPLLDTDVHSIESLAAVADILFDDDRRPGQRHRRHHVTP